MNIDDLKSVISNRKGLAQANRFEIHVTPPAGLGIDTRDFTILCESCSLPGRQITTIDYQILQQSYKIPSGFINEDVTFTFLLTNDFYIKKVFETWASAVVDFENYKVKYSDNYYGEISIKQLHRADRYQVSDDNINSLKEAVSYETVLHRAFPYSIGAISLDNNSENTIQKLTVTVAYENFENITK